MAGAVLGGAGNGLVGWFLLNRAKKNIDDSIARAANQGNNLIVQFGQELRLAIQQAEAAYGDQLDRTIDKIDELARRNINEIATLAQNLDNSINQAKQVGERVEGLFTRIPFVDRSFGFSWMTKFVPGSIFSSGDQDHIVPLKFRGGFPHVFDHQISLRFSGKESLEPVQTDSSTIVFHVPSSFLINPYQNRLSFISGILSWKKNPSWNPFYMGSIAATAIAFSNTPLRVRAGIAVALTGGSFVYSLWGQSSYQMPLTLGLLPPSPGQIEIQWVNSSKTVITKPLNSGEYFQTSSKKTTKKDINKPYTLKPDSGWEIVNGSSSIETIWKRGSPPPTSTFVSEDASTVVYRVSTKCRGRDRSGEIRFKLHAKQTRTETKKGNVSEKAVLKWGESIVRDVPPEYKVVYQAFDGVCSEFAGPTLSNRYLEISQQGGQLKIAVKNPEEISFS